MPACLNQAYKVLLTHYRSDGCMMQGSRNTNVVKVQISCFVIFFIVILCKNIYEVIY